MANLTEVLKDVWRWTWFSEDKGMNFNGYAVNLGSEWGLIDPPYANEKTWKEISDLGKPTFILLTNKDHERASDELRQFFKIPIYVHEADAPLLNDPADHTFKEGQKLFHCLDVIRFHHLKSPGECAFLWKTKRILFVGDVVTGHPKGSIGLVKKHEGEPLVLEDLQKLLSLDFDILLMGDGEPFVQGGKKAVQHFLSGDAQQRYKRATIS